MAPSNPILPANAKFFLILALMVLTGCTLIPGSKLTGKTTASSWVSETSDDYKSEVEFVQITPKIINKLKQEQPKATPNSPELQEALNKYDYKIGVNDVLNIIVYDHPEITIPSGSFRGPEESGNKVYSDGTIYFPYIGQLSVIGKTTMEVQQEIASKISNVIENPQVDVKIAAYNSKFVYISGEVNQPGVIPIKDTPMTIIEALTASGGLSAFADPEGASLTRNGIKTSVNLTNMLEFGDFSNNMLLQAGDSINVPRNDHNKVFVMGEVNRPKSILMDRRRMSLAEALGSAEGINERTANAKGIFVLRNASVTDNNPESNNYSATAFQLNASNATAFLLAEQFQLQPRDVVYVTAAPIALWNRLISQLLPTIVATENIGDIENQ